MGNNNTFFQKFKPGVPKRVLFFIAGSIWTFAGLMLMYRGSLMIEPNQNKLFFKLLMVFFAGGLFYFFMFDKISQKHAKRIKDLPNERPCIFAFFNLRGYLIMIFMISMGVFFRTTEIVPLKYLGFVYMVMGIPLFASALRFYYNVFFVKKK